MKKNKTVLLAFLISTIVFSANAQQLTKRALFLGNSYTAVNNLPKMVEFMAYSTDDSLIYEVNTPGGYTLKRHSTNATTLSKIAKGNWDYVVLQEQSQLPSFPPQQVEVEVFPYAKTLDSLINIDNPCAETVFYMTWGRKNGDASNCPFWPPVCTYEGMDSLLNLRYRMMADSNDAVVSPVGAVWNYIRKNYPSIELYSGDESHPSLSGTYAAACCFYTILFEKDPTQIMFNTILPASDADKMKNAAKVIVYDNLSEWNVGKYLPEADFSYSDLGNYEVSFTSNSTYAKEYLWDFGDGNTSSDPNPTHTYSTHGTYSVKHFALNCELEDSSMQTINITPSGIKKPNFNCNIKIYPNPTSGKLIIEDENTIGAEILIYNNLGELVLRQDKNSEKATIDLKHLPNGIYYIHLIDLESANRQVILVVKE
jgi:hypothetical protein